MGDATPHGNPWEQNNNKVHQRNKHGSLQHTWFSEVSWCVWKQQSAFKDPWCSSSFLWLSSQFFFLDTSCVGWNHSRLRLQLVSSKRPWTHNRITTKFSPLIFCSDTDRFFSSKRERRETLSRMHESMLNLGALDSEVFENARKSFMDIKFSFLGKKLARESLIVVKEEDDCGDEDGEEDETKPCNNETTERTIHEKSFGDKAKSESSLHARNDQSEQFNLQPEEMNVPRRRHTDSSTGAGNVQKSKMNQWMRQRPNWKANSDGTHSWGVKGGTHIYK